MIEFKQIIGRGTRVFDGKEFFTVFDFVKAHHNFADSDWDGEPLSVEDECVHCGNSPCSCETFPPKLCATCDNNPCLCEKTDPQSCPDCGEIFCTCQQKIEIKLSDGKVRQIKHISSVMYWSTEGKPITGKEFIARMFDDLPHFFENEDQLREIWSNPDTREKLLSDLTESGYDAEKTREYERAD
jgi:type I restriction enzyme R subunit